MKIDFHCHLFYEQMTPEFMKSQFQAFEGYSFYNRMLEGIEQLEPFDIEDPIQKTIKIAERAQLDKIVLLATSKNENERIKEWVEAQPDLFIPFFNPPEKLADKSEIRIAVEKALNEEGFKGLKIMLPFRGKRIDNESLFSAYEVADEKNFPVLFHSGYPPPGTPATRIKLNDANPVFIDSVVASFPSLKIILAHMGYPWIDVAIEMATQFPNICLDISNLTYMQPNRMRDGILYAKDEIGLDKILFGSDGFCPEMIEVCVKNFTTMAIDYLTETEINKIMGLNAKKILNLE